MDAISKLIERWRAAHQAHGWDESPESTQNKLTGRQRAELRREAGLPAFRWCCFGVDEFERRTSSAKQIVEFCRSWRRDMGSAVLCGPTGVGKTLCLIALAHRLIDILSRDLKDEDACFLRRIRFVRCSSLVKAADRFPLGKGEPPLVTRSVSASLLLCDDLGNEGPDRTATLFEVLDRRYLACTPTIVTTYLERAELQERYGDAMLRRLTDQGAFIATGET
jgi:DNA replication protein DnaC